MKIYCKRHPVGTFLFIPDSWRGYNYWPKNGKDFVSIDSLNGWDGEKLPCFVGRWEIPETIEEMCQAVVDTVDTIPNPRPNFWLVYYYSYDNICILAAEENYFEGSDYEVVEVVLEGEVDERISKQNT